MAKNPTTSTPPVAPTATATPAKSAPKATASPTAINSKLAKQQEALSKKLETANQNMTEQNRETKKLTTRTKKLYEKQELVTKSLTGVEKTSKRLEKKMDNVADAYDQSDDEILEVAVKHEDLAKKMDQVITGYDLILQSMKNSKHGPVLNYTGNVSTKMDPALKNILIQISKKQKDSLVQLKIIANRVKTKQGQGSGTAGQGQGRGSGTSGSGSSSLSPPRSGSGLSPTATPALDRKRAKARTKAEETAQLEEEIENMSPEERRRLIMMQRTERQLKARAEADVGFNRSLFQRMGNSLRATWEESDSRIVRGGASALLAAGGGISTAVDKITNLPPGMKQIKGAVKSFKSESNRRRDEKREVFVKERLDELRESNKLTEVHKRDKDAQAVAAQTPTLMDKVRNKLIQTQVSGQLKMIDVLDKINKNIQLSAVMNSIGRIGSVISSAMSTAIPAIIAAVTGVVAGGGSVVAGLGAAVTGAAAVAKGSLPKWAGGTPQAPQTGTPSPTSPQQVGQPNGKNGGYSRKQRQQMNRQGTRHAMSQSAKPGKIQRVPGTPKVSTKAKGNIFKKMATMLTKRIGIGIAKKAPLLAMGVPGMVLGALLTATDVAYAASDVWKMLKAQEDEANASIVSQAVNSIKTPNIGDLESSTAGQMNEAISTLDQRQEEAQIASQASPDNASPTETTTGVGVSNVVSNVTNNHYGRNFDFDNSPYQTTYNKGSAIIR